MRVVIADDHDVVREGVRSVVESYDEYHVCGEAANGLEAVKQTLDCDPNVVILDLTMPVMNGLDAARLIHKKKPQTPIIILSMHEYSARDHELTKSGVRGYVNKSKAADELIHAIQKVASGQTYFPRSQKS